MPPKQDADRLQVGEATFACGPEAPFHARTAVAAWVNARAEAELRDDACRLVSELVTNSIRHADQPAGSHVVVRAAAVDGVVRVEVHDQGKGIVHRRAAAPPESGSTSSSCSPLAGVSTTTTARVWFELPARHARGRTAT